ncbi:toxin VasX [Thorsellia anophelis]|uniref:Toxin VasX N-terminal region domain-containing protein n=1 Tax=Thorsellia anophelis DSM 18579 TaxID=1123402 RepID=A0A1I0FHI4_9GAMM|nr:toxin VasX [Thorsellia anophelis]SET57572.1 hypothetical protein SAMN02583745_02773 [Thorsellia anophelis DSM 18579]
MQCNFCHREGLAILPMRAALIPHNSQFTFLPQNIEMPVDAQGETNYTATLLKEGYLYIFNEKNQEWISYYCTPNGYYSLLLPNSTEFKSSLLAKNEPCSDKPLEQARSRLITLPMDKPGITDRNTQKNNSDYYQHIAGIDPVYGYSYEGDVYVGETEKNSGSTAANF